MRAFILPLFILTFNFSFSQEWKTNLEEAQQLAQQQNKNIILVFSGSDWCAPCIKLDKNIWQSEVFKKEAEKKWILLRADFPKKKANQLSAELAQSNKQLAEKYNPNGNFPLVVVLNPLGKVKGMLGYENVLPQEYIDLIHSLENK